MLNYHAEHVRRLIRQNTIRAAKAGADYRIPLSELFAVLVKRHREDYQSTPDLLPSLQPIGAGDAASGQVELAIDVSMRLGCSVLTYLGETPAIVDGQMAHCVRTVRWWPQTVEHDHWHLPLTPTSSPPSQPNPSGWQGRLLDSQIA
jgi:excisionase family DNA binding protein